MYRNKTDRELIELLTKYKKLTFESQMDLNAEIIHRNLPEDTCDLENSIDEKKSEIENLNYLDSLGFKADKYGESIRVTRTNKAVLIDIISITLGIIFCLIGLLGIFDLIGTISGENELSIASLFKEIIMIAIGFLGIKLLAGVIRLIDYSGFELQNNNGTIILKKRFDTKLVEIHKSTFLLELEEQSDLLTLKLDNDHVLSANINNVIQKMTLYELTKKLKTNAVEANLDQSKPISETQ